MEEGAHVSGILTQQNLFITPLVVPQDVDDDDAAEFRELARLSNAVCRRDAGHDYFDAEPAQMLPDWLDQTDETMLGFVARSSERIVGIVIVYVQNEDGATSAGFDPMVEPELWGRGIEDQLVEIAVREVRSRGLTALQTWTLHRPDTSGSRLRPPTGFGSIPADDRQTRLMLDHGFTLEQVERNSVFDLRGSFDEVERMLAEAEQKAGPEYRLVTWTSPTPPQYKDGFAFVLSRMSTDTPDAGMIYHEEIWDAARVDRHDARLLDGGHTVSVACVVHEPTGRVVAYNELAIAADHTRATHQFGTLVVREHRGHRLGTIVKCANLLRWRDLVPESPRVSTFNAEENRPMLDINEAIGFVPVSYAGAWKKMLT